MNFKKIDGSPKTFILVFQTGDELAAWLLQFAKVGRQLQGHRCTFVGAIGVAQLGKQTV